jgi:Family of unknown function (DUF6266)
LQVPQQRNEYANICNFFDIPIVFLIFFSITSHLYLNPFFFMARYNSVALGKARGSAGNVRFSIWKGIPVASQKPETVANPRTPKQLSARSRITALVSIFRKIPAFVDSVYSYLAIQKSAYNAWMSAQNKDTFLTFDASNICTGIIGGDLQIANQNLVIGSFSVSEGATSYTLTFAGLTPSRSYSIIVASQIGSSDFNEVTTLSDFATNSTGGATVSVDFSGFDGGGANTLYSVIQDTVTGLKYAYIGVV